MEYPVGCFNADHLCCFLLNYIQEMNKTLTIGLDRSHDVRFNLKGMAGTDAIHSTPVYSSAVCRLETGNSVEGLGLALTLGTVNQLVCETIDNMIRYFRGKELKEVK